MTAAHATVRRLDYTPSPYLIDRVDLTFELEENTTHVLSRLVVKRGTDTPDDTPLVLDGEALVLESVKIDGTPLRADQYTLDKKRITLPALSDTAILEIATRIDPATNTTLSGLYLSNGNFITQCEAEGFRRITYYLDRPDVMAKFTTTIIADKTRYPVLLSNGNRVGSGNSDKNRHWVKWVDPFKKPAYLFALVAGRFVSLVDTFTTASGRDVALEIHVEPGNIDKCHHAMTAAKKAMRWDEERFGLEYDLDTYMIVATSDFNMGAMENKGLNIFNTKFVLARPDTATDADFDGIDSVVAHEYFHNWTGNRVTCRDWFQLSLKEGLTVYRDQEFSSDLGSRAVQRIQNVRSLRETQFAEDSGPQAHPIRPDEYLEINNFYTWTVYEKGAEVVRMYATLLGQDGFRKGMDLYFKRHDGQAVTCDDFRAAMADANDADLEQFGLWYQQAGTPVLDVEGVYNETAHTYTLTVQQRTPATPGQPDKLPLHMPLAIGLLDRRGEELPLQLAHEAIAGSSNCVLALRQAVEIFTFVDIPCRPVPSLLRGFSAPVRLNYGYSDDELVFLMAHDSDAFARWEAANTYAGNLLRSAYHALGRGESIIVAPQFIDAFAKLLTNEQLDPALVALMLELPSENALFEALNDIDPAQVHNARQTIKQVLARELRAIFIAIYQRLNDGTPYRYDSDAIARRSLKNICLNYLAELEDPLIAELLAQQYRHADNMTDRLAALAALIHRADGEPFLTDFGNAWQDDALVMDKWFSLCATSHRAGALNRVQALMQHPAFSLRNPNKVRALIGAFCLRNPLHFHALDGYGYAFAADRVIELDHLNPQIAARMASCFNRWTKLEPVRQALMKGELERIAHEPGLSADTFEIVSKALAV